MRERKLTRACLVAGVPSPVPFETDNEPCQTKRLRESVAEAVDNYFKQLDGQPAANVYDLVLNEIEAPLLEAVMLHTRDNQTRASEVLGLNRGTLRKKLKQYGLL